MLVLDVVLGAVDVAVVAPLLLKASVVEIDVAEEDIEAREAEVGAVEVLEIESYRSRENGLGEDSVDGGRRDDDPCDEKENDGSE